MKVWLKILSVSIVGGLLYGFTMFCFGYFEYRSYQEGSKVPLEAIMSESNAFAYGIIFFLILLTAGVAWNMDVIRGKNKK